MSMPTASSPELVPIEDNPALPSLVYNPLFPPDGGASTPPTVPTYNVGIYRSQLLHRLSTHDEAETLHIPLVFESAPPLIGHLGDQTPWYIHIEPHGHFKIVQVLQKFGPKLLTYWHRVFLGGESHPAIGTRSIRPSDYQTKDIRVRLKNGAGFLFYDFQWLKLRKGQASSCGPANIFFQVSPTPFDPGP